MTVITLYDRFSNFGLLYHCVYFGKFYSKGGVILPDKNRIFLQYGDSLPCAVNDVPYLHNRSYLYRIGTEQNGYRLKLVTMKTVKNSLVEFESCSECQHYDEKMQGSIWRAKNRIFELAMCNNWQWFFTGTLSPEKYNRFDLDKFHKDLTLFFRNKSKLKIFNGSKIDFLLIPEQHKDGAWHMHGLLSGVPVGALQRFEIGDKMSSYIASKVRKGEPVYNWVDYQNKFGFCDLEPIKDNQAVFKYITKYINKNILESVKDLNAQVYYRSRGLNEPIKIKEGFMSANINPSIESPETKSFGCEFCSVLELPYSAESMQNILDSFI